MKKKKKKKMMETEEMSDDCTWTQGMLHLERAQLRHVFSNLKALWLDVGIAREMREYLQSTSSDFTSREEGKGSVGCSEPLHLVINHSRGVSISNDPLALSGHSSKDASLREDGCMPPGSISESLMDRTTNRDSHGPANCSLTELKRGRKQKVNARIGDGRGCGFVGCCLSRYCYFCCNYRPPRDVDEEIEKEDSSSLHSGIRSLSLESNSNDATRTNNTL